MAFVNEYVSEENIRKYELEALYKKWLIWIPPRFQYAWTFDAERDIYYIRMETGREEDSNQTRGVLYYRGIHWDVKVLVEKGTSLSFLENPYRQIWGLIHIKHPEGGLVPEDEIVPVLKEALTVHQVFGIYTPTGLNVVTSFTF